MVGMSSNFLCEVYCLYDYLTVHEGMWEEESVPVSGSFGVQ